MTIHPAAVVASIGVVLVASAATWLTQRALNRRRTPDSEDAEFRQWQWLWFAYSVPLAVLTWAVFTITGTRG